MGLGEDRVRLTFNPGGDELVNEIKRMTAELIDLCEEHKNALPDFKGASLGKGEIARLWALAMTAYEEAAMWATKAATAGK